MAEYGEAERQMALDIYKAQGATAAARAIGCSRQTVYQWLHQEMSSDEDDQKEREARHRMLRQMLRDRLLLVALRLTDRALEPFTVVTKDGQSVELDEPPGWEVQKLMVAAGIAVDKYRLEMGETTGRHQVSVEAVESSVDAELRKAIEEMRRQPAP